MLIKWHVALLMLCLTGLPANGTTTSTTSRPVVVELFTSQGCSSCLPAEALLGENTGHTLKEYNIVRSFQQLPSWDGHATRIDALLDNIPAGADRIAILVQQPGQGLITGAASLPL